MPQIYSFPRDSSTIFQTFLGQIKPLATTTDLAVSYNEYEKEWRINGGGIHGLKQGQEIDVYAGNDPAISYPAIITQLMVSQAVIRFREGGMPILEMKKGGLRAKAQLNTGLLKIRLTGDEKGTEMLRPNIEGKTFVQMDDVYPDYEIKAQAGKYHITSPGDDRVIIRQIAYILNGAVKENGAALLGQWLDQMAKWKFLRDLHENPQGKFSLEYPIQLRAFQFFYKVFLYA